ncbi:hypothetical protein RUND412_001016 [Rhizina undulata]
MPSKRKKKSSKSSAKNSNKRPRADSDIHGDDFKSGFEAARGYVDPSTGQRGAFPGLEEDDGEFYGPANDGIDYLRMVRSEAKGVPSLLVANPKLLKPLKRPTLAVQPPEEGLNYDDEAPEKTVEEQGGDDINEEEVEEEEDNLGWYYDGTYTASAPIIQPTESLPPTALEIWHAALLDKFRKLRLSLHTSLQKVPRTSSPRREKDEWRNRILYTAPTPKELWSLDQQTVLTLLRWNIHWLTLSRKRRWWIGKFWAAWMWSLLLKLDECLTADEISIVRELGKRCALVKENLIKFVEEDAVEKEVDELEYNGEDEDYADENDEGEYLGEHEDVIEGEPEEPVVEGELKKPVIEGESEEPVVEGEPDEPVVEGEPEGPIVEGEKTVEKNLEVPFKDGPTEAPETTASAHDKPVAELKDNAEDLSKDIPAEATGTTESAPYEPVFEAGDKAEDPSQDVPSEASGNNASVPGEPKEAIESTSEAINTAEVALKQPSAASSTISATPSSIADTLGALDMVISIVGDFFGQRDLLISRPMAEKGLEWDA